MKFMKKLTALSVACLMGLTLTGCGGNDQESETDGTDTHGRNVAGWCRNGRQQR